MKILLTGATGFTGHHFIKTSLAAGYQIHALQANLTDKLSLKREIDEVSPDYVVHLGGISFVAHQNDVAFYEVNTIGTGNLLDVLSKTNKVRKILLASSANIYGNCSISPIQETQPPAPVNHYAMSKLAMEYMSRLWMEQLPIVIARPFNYTGLGQSQNFIIPKLINHYAKKLPCIELGNIDVEREYNDVRMVCEVYLELLIKGLAGEVYNVCTNHSWTLRQVMTLLEELTHHQPEITINSDFIRANEVKKLCGDPRKIQNFIKTTYTLQETLVWMLQGFDV